jgi:ABC transport system ATP-binding/permease protein
MQLFALVSDIGNVNEISAREKNVVKSFLARHLNSELVEKYLIIFEEYLDLFLNKEAITMSTGDFDIQALKTLRIKRICEGINKELRQKQKIYIIIQLIDFISYGKEITANEIDFLMIVALALNIPENEYRNIKSFIIDPVSKIHEKDKLLVINNNPVCKFRKIKHIYNSNFSGELIFLNIVSVKTFILRYNGDRNLFLNGQNILSRQSYLFDNGSTIKGQGLNTIYYSEVFGYFNDSKLETKISLTADNVTFRFAESENGIQNFNFYEESGQLVGILGVSGTGKSTLLNLLNGNIKPQSGSILINGFNINNENEKDKLKGIIGYIPQDDLLIEELTVFQNLYFNARLCLSNLPKARIKKIIGKIMVDLDLWEVRDLKVGNPLDKVISGGQRKRINIALELIREPYILFVDEPTSGLSSVDSEVVINLLKEQTYKGKLVIVNIHQPGSDLFKLFDKIIILDKGGHQIFYGNPNSAVVYFKTQSMQANPEEDQCILCGNINTEQILQIVEAKIVNEHGKLTQTRKITPEEWSNLFREKHKELPRLTQVHQKKLPENFYSIPGKLRQTGIFFTRDILSKLANRQYILISMFGAPLLALILGYFTRYAKGGTYQFIENVNLPAYIFMSVITAMFFGLIISSEEILKDRKILKRESFLNLSWFSYINSKIIIVFLISAIQTISYILVGNSILEIKGMTFHYWLVLFTTSCCANMIGLNLSSALNSVITIYILIPFIIIPQMLFSGVLVKYDKLHINNRASNEYVPFIGELMPSRWSFEALAVEQYKNNRYEKIRFPYDMEVSRHSYFDGYLIPALNKDLYYCQTAMTLNDTVKNYLEIINYHIEQLSQEAGFSMPGSLTRLLNEGKFDSLALKQKGYLYHLSKIFGINNRHSMDLRDKFLKTIAKNKNDSLNLIRLETDYTNKSLATFVLNDDMVEKSVQTSRRIIRKYQPIYMPPTTNYGRAHFCAPFKIIGNLKIDTFWFNLIVIWLVLFLLYLALYFNLLRKLVSGFGDANKRIRGSSFLIIKEISSL